MKVVYVAGPYRGKSEHEVVQNIRRAEALALEVWREGAACICPHKNTALFGGAHGLSDSVWLKGDLELISRCDAVIMTPDYERSAGAIDEMNLAYRLGLPVFRDMMQLRAWLRA